MASESSTSNRGALPTGLRTLAAPDQQSDGFHWSMWIPSIAMLFCSLLSYLDRQTLAVLSPLVLHDTGMSVRAYADALSVFSFAYMVSNLFWGAILERIGLRSGMLLAVGLWSLSSAAHAWVTGFAGFALARGLLGFGEGATFPGGMQTATSSLPASRRARGMSIAYSGSALGSILAPLLVTPIALHWSWRGAFLATGIFGLAWLAVWWFVARPSLLAQASTIKPKTTWPNMLERRFWNIVVLFGLGASALGPILYLSPLYLSRVMNLPQAKIGAIVWIPAMGWGLGYYFWGWFADRYVRHWERPTFVLLPLAAMALPLTAAPWISSVTWEIALFTWSMFIAVAFIVLSLHLGARDYPPHQSGLVAGIGSGAWSAVVVALLPIYGRWFERHWFGAIFTSLSLLPLVGVLLWLALLRKRPRSNAEERRSTT